MSVIKKLFILVILLSLFLSIEIKGEELKSSERYNRILFVIDCSGSMNENDANRISSEIVKMFVDGLYSSRTDIGFLTFNSRILESFPLTSMEEMQNREDIKGKIDSIERNGGTDIGIALNYGMDMFINNPKENSKPIMIFFSDGDTEHGGMVDENMAFAKSKQIGCPIYTVGLSKDGSLNTEYLKNISNETSGSEYEITNSDESGFVFKSLFKDLTGKSIIEKGVIKGTGAVQTIAVDMPEYYADEANIFLQHNEKLAYINVDNDFIYASKNFTSIKVLHPKEKSIRISFIAKKDDDIKVNLVSYTDMYPKIEIPNSLTTREIEIKSQLYSLTTGEVLSDQSFYEGLKGELIIQDAATRENVILEMDNLKDHFLAIYENSNPKFCNVKVNISNDVFSVDSIESSMMFSNTPPIQTSDLNKTVMKSEKSKEYDLNNYFKDFDGDILSYGIVNDDNNIAKIEGSKLKIIAKEEGDYLVSINASDGRGGVIMGKLIFNVVPIWIYFRNVIIGVLLIFILLLILYFLFIKKVKENEKQVHTSSLLTINSNTKFSGARFEGYFLNTLSGNDVPVLNWNASYIDNKQIISLGDLFFISDVDEKLPESYKIYFQAGNNGTVIFYHNTECIISLLNRDIPRGKKEVLSYDDRLYIVFEDHVTEIEIRYKRVRRTNMTKTLGA